MGISGEEVREAAVSGARMTPATALPGANPGAVDAGLPVDSGEVVCALRPPPL